MMVVEDEGLLHVGDHQTRIVPLLAHVHVHGEVLGETNHINHQSQVVYALVSVTHKEQGNPGDSDMVLSNNMDLGKF